MMRTAAVLAMATAISLAQTNPAPAGKGSSTARKTAPAAPAALPTYKDLKYPELRSISLPAMDSSVLPNGMRLYLLENHELPLINGMVLVRTGTLFDPPDKIGLATLTGNLLVTAGTTARPGLDVVRYIQDLGAEIGSNVTENTATISFSALKDNADEVLDVFKDVLTAPEFQQDRIDLAKVRLFNSIAHRNDDAAAILQREFAGTVYGKDTPYGAQMEYSTLDRINRRDVVSFYQRYFFPRNVMLSLEGDFDSAEMKARIEALFSEWHSEQPPVPEFPKASTDGAPGKYLAVKKDLKPAYFAVGQIGGDYLDKDCAALQVMAEVLGGGPQSRLNQRFREDSGNLSAKWTAGWGHPGLFEIAGSVNAFKTTQVIQAVFEELARIRTVEVSEEELKTAKDGVLNNLAFAFDNQFSIVPRLTQYEYFNLPRDYTAQYQKALDGVTRADVLRAAKERLNPASMTVLVVGNPTAFELPLESLGGAAARPIDLTIPPPAKREAILGDPVSLRRGKELLARAQQAMGGTDKLAAVTDYVEEIGYQYDAAAGGAQATMTERWLTPGYLRQDSTMATGKFSVFSDGKAGWVASAQGSAALNGVQMKQVQGDLFRILFSLLLSDRVATRKVNALDDNTVEISDGAGQIVKAVFDSGTGLLRNVLYDGSTANGPVPVIEAYSDYREQGGLKLPFKVGITLAGQKFQEITVKNIQLNTGLKLEDMERRP